jgi:hypothetical protein
MGLGFGGFKLFIENALIPNYIATTVGWQVVSPGFYL